MHPSDGRKNICHSQHIGVFLKWNVWWHSTCHSLRDLDVCCSLLRISWIHNAQLIRMSRPLAMKDRKTSTPYLYEGGAMKQTVQQRSNNGVMGRTCACKQSLEYGHNVW
jgi:hypothetical protein